MPFGPQAGSGFMSPTPQQPMGMDPNQQWAMQDAARQQAMMYGMRGMLNNQYSGNAQSLGMSGARLGNSALGNPLGSVLRPVGQAVKSAASGLLGTGAQQSYNVGGATTLGNASANAAGLTASQTAGSQAATSAAQSSPSLLGVAGQGLGIAAAGYGAYAGFTGAQKSLDNLHTALSYGLSPEHEAELRQATFRSGAQSAAVGGIAGGLSGSSYGPYGAVVGAALGGAPGAYQAWQSADSGGERFEAQKQFQRNPFRR